MDKIEVRAASVKDIDAIITVLDKAFKRNISEVREIYDKKYEEIEKNIDQWLVLEVEGNIIGTVRIHKHWMKIGKSNILKGDVGDVAILPEHQGKGYGHKLMEEAVKWMKENNFDISRLGGLCRFYKRFGYIRFPRRYIEIEIGRKARAGASFVEEGELPIDEEMLKKIDIFRETDRDACIKLREEFYSRYNGVLIDEDFGVSQIFYVFREGNEILGYIGGVKYEEEFSEFEAKITIYNLAYKWNKPYVLQTLLKYINNFAYKNGINRITLRIPFDPEIIEPLLEIPFRFKAIETYGGATANMLQIINIMSLFNRLVPELEERLRKQGLSSYSKVIKISTEKDIVILDINKGKIKILKDKKADTELKIKEFYLLHLILGLLSFSEVEEVLKEKEKIKIIPEERNLLNVLFPRFLVFSGIWG
ncbi:MAG: GNAT family N-acetyltransferase [Candidatus Omnitrophica bacterium]|nr:GNAT family N-acetyltransferase [Candidatus Omnitrophota bacterium]MCM8807094.1 GNAT family N-acetyltransferase [Candidatus Omnitrophota bacterium]